MQGVFGPWYPTDNFAPESPRPRQAEAGAPSNLAEVKSSVLLVRESKLPRRRWPLTLQEHRQILEALVSYGARAIMVDLVLLDKSHSAADWREFCDFLKRYDSSAGAAGSPMPLILFADNRDRSETRTGLIAECHESGDAVARARHDSGWVATAYAPKTWDPVQGVVRRYPATEYPTTVPRDGRDVTGCATSAFLIYQWLLGGEKALHAQGESAFHRRCMNMPVPADGMFSDEMTVLWSTQIDEHNAKWLHCDDHGVFEHGGRSVDISGWLYGIAASLTEFTFLGDRHHDPGEGGATRSLQQTCPPMPIVPLEGFLPDLFNPAVDRLRLDEDIQEILENSVVFYGVGLDVGADVIYTPTHGALPGVIFHSMAFDNLLKFGANYYRRHAFIGQILEVLIGLMFVFGFHYISSYIAPAWRREAITISRGKVRLKVRMHLFLGILVAGVAIAFALSIILIAHFYFRVAPMDWVFLSGVGGLGLAEIFGGRSIFRLECAHRACIV